MQCHRWIDDSEFRAIYSMSEKHPKIAILHHTGGGNFGDDAIMDAVIHNISRRWPNADLTALSMNPEDTERRHGIVSLPIRTNTWGIGYTSGQIESHGVGKHGWLATTRNPVIRFPRGILREVAFLRTSFRRLRPFDILIVSGGGQLTERSGPWGFPYAIFIWVLLAKIAHVRRIFLSVGAGPLRQPLSRFFVRRALYAANYVSFRDVQSQALAKRIGFSGVSRVVPDNAYGLNATLPKLSADTLHHPIVGIAPMPWPFCDPREHVGENLQALYDEYLKKLAIFSLSLVKYSCSLELFGSDIGSDYSAIEDLRRVLRNQHDVSMPPYKPVDSVDNLLAKLAAMDYVVTCRFHGVVLAHMLNKPVLAIAHHPKVADLMDALGLAQYCVDIRTFEPAILTETFASLVDHAIEVKGSMGASLQAYRSKLAAHFDGLFPPADANALAPKLTEISKAEAESAGKSAI